MLRIEGETVVISTEGASKDVPQANESVADSFVDALNYAAFGFMFTQGADFTDDVAFFKAWEEAVEVARKVVRERRAKYGPGNLLIHRELGVVVRLSDKISRLNHFFFGPKAR